MTAKEVINAILMQENITGSQLAKDMGLSRPQAVYDILNGKVLKVSANGEATGLADKNAISI